MALGARERVVDTRKENQYTLDDPPGARSPKNAILTGSGNGARSQEERKKTESLKRTQVGHVRLSGKGAVDFRGMSWLFSRSHRTMRESATQRTGEDNESGDGEQSIAEMSVFEMK